MQYCRAVHAGLVTEGHRLRWTLQVPFTSVDILQDEPLRTALKEYSNWPTYPQLYVRGELVGGCDIVAEMAQSGELRALFVDKLGPNYEASAAPAAQPAAPAAPSANGAAAHPTPGASAAWGLVRCACMQACPWCQLWQAAGWLVCLFWACGSMCLELGCSIVVRRVRPPHPRGCAGAPAAPAPPAEAPEATRDRIKALLSGPQPVSARGVRL